MKSNVLNKHIITTATIAAIAGLLFGFDTGIISGALLFLSASFKLTALTKGLVVSCLLLGALFGAALSGRIADYFGRKPVVITTAIVFTIGALGSTFAPNFVTLIISRIIIGVAIGIGSYTAPLYISEVAPVELRGSLVTLNQLMITIGILASYIVSLIFSTGGEWRLMFCVGIFPALLLGVGMFFLPESPRWLVMKQYSDKARQVLQKLRQSDDVSHELSAIEHSIPKSRPTLKDVFAPWARPVLFLGLGLSVLQQASGINAVIYYAPMIFKMSGFQGNVSSIMATVGVGIVNVIFTVISIWLVDKVGRRTLLLTGMVGLILCLLTLSDAFHHHQLAGQLKWITLASLLVYIACFAFSLGAMFWLLISEIFPLRIRSFAMGITVAANWASNILVSVSFLSLVKWLGTGNTFLLYAVFCMIGLVFCYRYIPETKGCSLEQLETNLLEGKRLAKIGA